MITSIVLELVLIVGLILANGFFAASEIAIVSARKGRLEQMARDGQAGAQAALTLAENPNRFLSTVQVGITVISTFAAVFGGASLAAALGQRLQTLPVLAPYAGSIALVLVVLLISYLSLILGELVPKRLALQSAEQVSRRVAPFMGMLSRALSPMVGLLTFSTELVLRLLGRHRLEESAVTEDDIIALVREGASGGTVEAAEQELITNIFGFGDRSVRSLMTPRTQITALPIDIPFAEALGQITEAGYSRVPVYRGSLDQMVGLLYVKDLLPAWGQPAPPDLPALVRPIHYVLASQRALTAFQQLRQARSGMAMVIDEYGQVAGLITLEDILEQVVGAIDDEYDDTDESIVRRADGSYLVDGLLQFADVQQRVGLPARADMLARPGFETLAGFMLAQLGRIPHAGDRSEWQGYIFEVVDMDGRRIDKVLIVPPAGAAPPHQPDSSAG